MEEATVAGVTAVVEVIQDQPVAAPHHQGLMAVPQYVQVPGQQGQAPAEATAVALLVHHEQAQCDQVVQYGKDRAR